MNPAKRLLDFYLESSLHVALGVFALVQVTELRLGLGFDVAVSGFAFFGTVVGYNFVKYDALARMGKARTWPKLRAVIALSALSALACAWFFFRLKWQTAVLSGLFLVITALYTLPFFPDKKNGRSWAGLKIYFVSVCWVGVTVVLPVVNAGQDFFADVWIMAVQRFILVVVLLFIFEIRDLAWDDPHLHTVPQQIGVKPTKWLGLGLLGICVLLELFKFRWDEIQQWCNLGMVVITSVFLWQSTPKRSRYFTALFAETIPILWWISLMICENLR